VWTIHDIGGLNPLRFGELRLAGRKEGREFWIQSGQEELRVREELAPSSEGFREVHPE
jgi:hypothetical protein